MMLKELINITFSHRNNTYLIFVIVHLKDSRLIIKKKNQIFCCRLDDKFYGGPNKNSGNFKGSNYNSRNFEGSICNFWKFIGVNLEIFENLRTKLQI
jgi:hypothetical protein